MWGKREKPKDLRYTTYFWLYLIQGEIRIWHNELPCANFDSKKEQKERKDLTTKWKCNHIPVLTSFFIIWTGNKTAKVESITLRTYLWNHVNKARWEEETSAKTEEHGKEEIDAFPATFLLLVSSNSIRIDSSTVTSWFAGPFVQFTTHFQWNKASK